MKTILAILVFATTLAAQPVVLEDFKCATGTVIASPNGGPTTIRCLDASGNPQAHGFVNPTYLIIWGATGSWRTLNTKTFQNLKMITNVGETTYYLNDTAMLDTTPGKLYSIVAQQAAPGCTTREDNITISAVNDSRKITTSAAVSQHCNEDAFFGPMDLQGIWTATIVNSTDISIPLDSHTFGSFSGQTIRINRSPSSSNDSLYWGLPALYTSNSDGNAPLLQVDPHGYEIMTIDGCPSTADAIKCSFGFLSIFNQKGYFDFATTTSSLVVSGGTGTITITGFAGIFNGLSGRTLGANELTWLWNYNDVRVNRPWVTNSVTGTCSTSCVVTFANMNAGQGGTGLPDGTYTITGSYHGGTGFFMPLWNDYYVYFITLAPTLGYPNEYISKVAKGTVPATANHLRQWNCWSFTRSAQGFEYGTYVSTPSFRYHPYHLISFDSYGSPGPPGSGCQWQLFDVTDAPYHLVGGPAYVPQGEDFTYTQFASAAGAFAPFSDPAGTRHFFQALDRFYIDLSTIYTGALSGTSYIGPIYFDTTTDEPLEWTNTSTISYDPGGGKYRINMGTTTGGDQFGPCSALTYEFYHATSELRVLGLSSATSDGTVTGTPYGGLPIYQMNFTSPSLSYGNIYFGVRPRMCISGVSGNGASIQLSFRESPNMLVGDHISISGLGGNTTPNSCSGCAITAVQPRQYWFRSNQGFSVSPIQLTNITVTGTNLCTVNLTVAPNVFVGQEVGIAGYPTGIVFSNGLATTMSWVNVSAVGGTSFSVPCAGSTNGVYNTDYGGPGSGFYMNAVSSASITISGTGNGNWDGLFTGTMVSTENNKNFTELSFLPPQGTCNITPTTLGPYTQGVSIGTVTMTANNCGGGTLTWTSSSLPAGISGCNSVTGLTCNLTGTPSSAGTTTATISVTDGGSNSNSISPSIVVNPGSTPGGGAFNSQSVLKPSTVRK